MFLYTIVSYVAISLHMTMIKEFGGIATVLIGNARKAMTIILSFILFPKPGSVYYLLGGALVFGGLTLSAYSKEMGWGREGRQQSKGTAMSEGGGGGAGGGGGSGHQYTALPTQIRDDEEGESEEEQPQQSQQSQGLGMTQGWGQDQSHSVGHGHTLGEGQGRQRKVSFDREAGLHGGSHR
jgi:hypothetical protein